MTKLKKEKQGISHRFNHRDLNHEFLYPILNGKIFKDFDDSQGYINFSDVYLEENFREGHNEYFNKWKHLFLYETYSFLINTRFSKFTGNDLELQKLIKQTQEKTMSWKGYF
jgi:hypothetical protein